MAKRGAGGSKGRGPGDDPVGRLVLQWEAERPDLDLRTMATVARLLGVGRLVGAELAAMAAEHGLDVPEADLLFTLRRAGAPYRLTPSALSRSLLVSSGTLTSRLDRLERKGLVERAANPGDRRSVEVVLTQAGRELVDGVVTEHVRNEQEMLSILSEREIDDLNRLSVKLLSHLSERAGGRD
ncbi:MAG TPA: MarR family transcriptional regulator [Thermoleophilaceae bacterium]|jgi:DNA-binding MarR family transcriptional regulator